MSALEYPALFLFIFSNAFLCTFMPVCKADKAIKKAKQDCKREGVKSQVQNKDFKDQLTVFLSVTYCKKHQEITLLNKSIHKKAFPEYVHSSKGIAYLKYINSFFSF